jgi:hypothetical protein
LSESIRCTRCTASSGVAIAGAPQFVAETERLAGLGRRALATGASRGIGSSRQRG